MGGGVAGRSRLPALNMGPKIKKWDPQLVTALPHVGGRHIPDTAYTVCGADFKIFR